MVAINVVIIESHQHALEHIHHMIRKRKLFHKRWSMLHFDAHPDLACPSSASAMACFTPRQKPVDDNDDMIEGKSLYEQLDGTSSGIAEWILPLVLAADLRVVEWVKPTFSNQLPSGTHRFKVGAYCGSNTSQDAIKSFVDLPDTATVRVDWNHSYYWEDDSVVPSEQLVLAQTLELHVTEIETEPPLLLSRSRESAVGTTPWVLDICLDYFACLNPYLTDIDQEDPAVLQALLNVLQKATCSATTTDNQPTLGRAELDKLLQFRQLLKEILSIREGSARTTSLLIEEISGYYESIEQATTLILEFKEQLFQTRNNKLLSLVLEAIPYWNMPHAMDSVDAERISDSIARVEAALGKNHDGEAPFLITIARSTDDGFTPASVVEAIQERVIEMLHRVFCASANNCTKESTTSRLYILRDYGEWEGSTF